MKLYMKSFIILAIITGVGIGGFFTWEKFLSPTKADVKAQEPSIDDLLAESIDTEAITTNLKDGGIIKAKFKIICTSTKNAEEIKKLTFQIDSTIIRYLSGLKKEDLTGAQGISSLETNLKKKLNEGFGADYIKQIYTTDKLIQ